MAQYHVESTYSILWKLLIKLENTIEGDIGDGMYKYLISYVRDPQIALMKKKKLQRLANHKEFYMF